MLITTKTNFNLSILFFIKKVQIWVTYSEVHTVKVNEAGM